MTAKKEISVGITGPGMAGMIASIAVAMLSGQPLFYIGVGFFAALGYLQWRYEHRPRRHSKRDYI